MTQNAATATEAAINNAVTDRLIEVYRAAQANADAGVTTQEYANKTRQMAADAMKRAANAMLMTAQGQHENSEQEWAEAENACANAEIHHEEYSPMAKAPNICPETAAAMCADGYLGTPAIDDDLWQGADDASRTAEHEGWSFCYNDEQERIEAMDEDMQVVSAMKINGVWELWG